MQSAVWCCGIFKNACDDKDQMKRRQKKKKKENVQHVVKKTPLSFVLCINPPLNQSDIKKKVKRYFLSW